MLAEAVCELHCIIEFSKYTSIVGVGSVPELGGLFYPVHVCLYHVKEVESSSIACCVPFIGALCACEIFFHLKPVIALLESGMRSFC